LLHKQEPKRKKKIAGLDDLDEDGNVPPAPATFIRYITNANGSILSLPAEWVEAPAGELFEKPIKPLKGVAAYSGRMVQELD
jgi:Ino eighty subunit 2